MRKALTETLGILAERKEFCLLTGDLGFQLFEPLKEILGERFINAGIAEQNMISVAAGLAREGWRPWVYSIAPFCYARAFEQIRNDAGLHDLPVRILGNGAGYGYGVQGPTHHAIEDCAVMRAVRNMRVYAPAFAEDLKELFPILAEAPHPAYIRLGYDGLEKSEPRPEYRDFRIVKGNAEELVFVLGNLAGCVWNARNRVPEKARPTLCVCSTFPETVSDLPETVPEMISNGAGVLVAEEHVSQGGLGEALAGLFLRSGLVPKRFSHRFAAGYPDRRYGSQTWYRKLSGLDEDSMTELFLKGF